MGRKKKDLPTLEQIGRDSSILIGLSIDELHELKKKAEMARDPQSYAPLIEVLGEDPELPDLISAYIPQGHACIDQEKPALEHILSKAERNRVPKNYGLNRSRYLQTLDLPTLTSLWYGMNNLDLPPILMAATEPGNILTKYYVAGKKRDIRLEHHDFSTLCEEMNRMAYPVFRHPVNRIRPIAGWNRHFGKSKEKERYTFVPEKDKEAFISSYRAPYVPSKRENPASGADYDHPQGHLRKWYESQFMKGIEASYGRFQERLLKHGL